MRLVASLAVLASLAGPARGETVHRDFPYARTGSRVLGLDVAVPARPGRFPAILFVHGGTWMAGGKEMHAHDLLAAARGGFVGVSIDYRLAHEAPFPSQLEDVRRAVRWLRAAAPAYRIDPGRIAVAGASAGGHLALLAGLLPQPDPQARVQAIANLYGPTDLEAFYLASPGFRDALRLVFPSPAALRPLVHRLASPITWLSASGPPILTLHGTDDEAIPFFTAQLFAARALAVGARHQLAVHPGERHGFTPVGHQLALDRIFRFVRAVLPASSASPGS